MEISDSLIRMFAINPSKHYNAATIQKRIEIAIKMQTAVMRRDFEFWFKEKFGDAGFTT
jgi:hypothetical protein